MFLTEIPLYCPHVLTHTYMLGGQAGQKHPVTYHNLIRHLQPAAGKQMKYGRMSR